MLGCAEARGFCTRERETGRETVSPEEFMQTSPLCDHDGDDQIRPATVSVFRYCRSTHGCEAQWKENAFLCGPLDCRETYRQNLQEKRCVLLSYFTNQIKAVFICQITISPSSCSRFCDRGSSTQNRCTSFLLPFYFLFLVVAFYFGQLKSSPVPVLSVLNKIKVYCSLRGQTCIIMPSSQLVSKRQYYRSSQ